MIFSKGNPDVQRNTKHFLPATHVQNGLADQLGVVHTVKHRDEHQVAVLLLAQRSDVPLERLDDGLPVVAYNQTKVGEKEIPIDQST